MDANTNMLVIIYGLFIPLAETAIPGTFFWKPRLGLDLSIPTTEFAGARSNLPTKENIAAGLVVLVEGYSAGMTIISIASGAANAKTMPQFDLTSGYFYTHFYRWALRYLSLIPHWLSGGGGNFCDTHKVWRRRFFYMDEFVPKWLQKALFYVDKSTWKKEEDEFKKYKKYAESSFGKHFRYPSKVFNDFKSQETAETVDNMDTISSDSSEN